MHCIMLHCEATQEHRTAQIFMHCIFLQISQNSFQPSLRFTTIYHCLLNFTKKFVIERLPKKFCVVQKQQCHKVPKNVLTGYGNFSSKKKNEKLAQTQLHTVRPLVWKISRFLYYQKYNNTYYIPIVAVVFL